MRILFVFFLGALMLAAPAVTAAPVHADRLSAAWDSGTLRCAGRYRAGICNAWGKKGADRRLQNDGFVVAGRYDRRALTFDTLFTGRLALWEVTDGRRLPYVEAWALTWRKTQARRVAKVPRQATNTWGVPVGPNRWTIAATGAASGPFSQQGVLAWPNTPKGFGVNAASVAAVPLPAGLVLLLTALGGLALARRRR